MRRKSESWKVVHRDRFGKELQTWDGCGTKAEAFALLLSLFNGRREARGLPPIACLLYTSPSPRDS